VVTPKDPGLEDWYGWAAAIREDYALVSAFNRDELATNDGAAYVYARTTGSTWDRRLREGCYPSALVTQGRHFW